MAGLDATLFSRYVNIITWLISSTQHAVSPAVLVQSRLYISTYITLKAGRLEGLGMRLNAHCQTSTRTASDEKPGDHLITMLTDTSMAS